MAKHAGSVVSLAELRFKPANSNDAARAVFSHHFVNVPHCSFAKDDGISHYLGSETGMETFPASPDIGAPENIDIPAIQGESSETSGSLKRKLLRGGFALSIFLHAAAAIAFGFAVIAPPDDVALEEGVLSVTFVVEGNADADARAAGAEEEVREPEDKPVEKEPVVEEPVKPVEKAVEKQPEVEKPVQETTENILKDVPMPVLGADMPEILTAQTEAEAKTEIVDKPLPTEEKVEPPVEKQVTPVVTEKPVEKQPEEKPKPVEKKLEPKPAEKKPEKEKSREKRKQNKGNQGDQANDAKKGEINSDNRGKASTNSRGDAANRDIGNALRSNYKGLVNKKLSRAKGRVQAPAKGKVTVTFTIMANGTVSGLRISHSSGKAALDAAALKVVRSASPFPAIPADTGKKSWLMSVPMTFK